MDLRARAIITAIDRFSGPVTRMAGALNALTGRAATASTAFASRANAAATAASRMGSALRGPLTIGLGATIYATQEFERRLLGIQMASMAAKDELGRLRQVNDLKRLRGEAEELKASIMGLSKELGFSPSGLIAAGEAAAKLGVPLDKAKSVVRNAAIWNMAEHDYSPDEAAEFLGKTATLFRAPDDAAGYDKWLKAAADKIATVAAASPTDLHTFAEGLRQFGAAFAVSGGSIDQAAALLGTATMMGQDDIETGTALKMGLVRLISPTLGHVAALNNAGIDRSKYMDMTGSDPYRAINQLVRLFPGYIDKGLKRSLYEQLQAASKAGTGGDPAFIGDIAGRISKETGNKESIDDTYMKVLNAITTSGGKVDYYGYLRDIAQMRKEGKFNDAAFIEAFTKFHYSRMMAVLSNPELMDQYLGLAQSATGQGQDTRAGLYAGSEAGKWDATVASLQRSLIRLRESEGIRGLIEMVGSLANAVASMPPVAVEILGGVVAGLVALAGVGAVIGVAGAGLTALATGIGLLAGALASPVVLGLAGTAAAGYVGYQAYENWDKDKSWLGNLWDTLGPAGLMAVSPAVAAGKAYEGWDKDKGTLQNLWDSVVPDFGGMLRDYLPTQPLQVQTDVQGTVTGKVDVDVKVIGPGTVVDKRGGELTGTLDTGKSMPDAGGR